MEDIKEVLSLFFEGTGNTVIFQSELNKRGFTNQRIQKAISNQDIVYLGDAFNENRMTRENVFTLPYVIYMEQNIAKNAIAHAHAKSPLPPLSDEQIDELIQSFEKKAGWSLMSEQREAVHMAARSQMCIITGGPGTGKTTVINAIQYVENHRIPGEKPFIKYTAPTGKAARRITESVGSPAQTIQMCIGANEYEDIPAKIKPDIMVVDEISMLDTITTFHLMNALDRSSKLLLVGDVDQLPSVGYGSVLRDLIGCGEIPIVKLMQTMRQKGGTPLSENIDLVRNGCPDLKTGDDFKIIDRFSNNVVKDIIDTVLKSYDKWGVENVILLTPYRRKGETCANVMNVYLQDAVNPNGQEIQTTVRDVDEDGYEYSYDVRLRVGDPVMQLVNRKDCPVANGDVGKITGIYKNGLLVDFGHYQKIYKDYELCELTLAYAMSVHKSQGSEYKCVVTIALKEHEMLLNRNLVYTAITRAKKECILFAEKSVLETSFAHEGGWERFTFLVESFEEEINKEKRRNIALSWIKLAA